MSVMCYVYYCDIEGGKESGCYYVLFVKGKPTKKNEGFPYMCNMCNLCSACNLCNVCSL